MHAQANLLHLRGLLPDVTPSTSISDQSPYISDMQCVPR